MMQPEPIKRPSQQANQVFETCVKLVRRWPSLRAENKLAWEFLWKLSNAGSQLVPVTATEIAADQGTTTETGHTRVKNLLAQGLLIQKEHDSRTGSYLLEILDPRAVAQARHIEWDGQHTFDFAGEPDTLDISQATSRPGQLPGCAPACDTSVGAPRSPNEEPPEVPPEDPRSSTFYIHSDNINKLPSTFLPSPSQSEGGANSKTSQARGTSGGTSDPDAPKKLGDSIAERFAHLGQGPDHEANEARLLKLAKGWRERIKDPNMRDEPLLKMAEAVDTGRIKLLQVLAVFNNLDRLRRSGELRSPASAYVNGAFKKLLARAA